ncbi:MAG: hypothetical protein ABI564_04870 [Ideonella sp.]
MRQPTLDIPFGYQAHASATTNPVPMAFTELFTAMETKAVDGADQFGLADPEGRPTP